MTNTSINLNSAANRLDRTRPALSLVEELLAQWECHFRSGRYIMAHMAWQQVEKARRAN